MEVFLDISSDFKDETRDENVDVPLTATNNKKLGCLYDHHIPATDHQKTKEKRRLISAIAICLIFMIAELLGGYISGSLAIMTDAAHLLSDCISFLIALIAILVSNKFPDAKMSFGYKRVEVIGALLSIFGIWALTAVLVVLAVQRIIDQNFDIHADSMIIVSSLGVIMNIVTAFVLHGSCSISGHNHTHFHSHSHSHMPQTMKPKLLLPETLKKCSEKKCEKPENLSPGYLTPNTGLLISSNTSRHNSFSKGSDSQKPNLDSILNIAKIKLQEPLRQRMSIDAGSSRNSPDILSSNKINYSRLDSEENLSTISHDELTDSLDSCETHSSASPIESNINIRAAVIHVIGDLIQSFGVLVAAVIIKLNPSLKIFDPICTFVFSIIVLLTTVKIFKDSIMILLDAVPNEVNLLDLEEELACIEGVRSVHYLKVWSQTIDWHIMTTHLIVDQLADPNQILTVVKTIASTGFNIKSSTVQIEKYYANIYDE